MKMVKWNVLFITWKINIFLKSIKNIIFWEERKRCKPSKIAGLQRIVKKIKKVLKKC